MSADRRRFDLEEIDGVTIARFVDKKIIDEANIHEIGKQMFALIVDDGRRKIILDFSRVEYLSSAAIGKLTMMDKKAQTAKAKLRFCCMRPEIYEVFVLVHFDKTFDIKLTRDEALEGF